MLRTFLVFAALCAFAFYASLGLAHEPGSKATAFGVAGDPKKKSRVVKIVMGDAGKEKMWFEPSRIEVKRGEQIRFELSNDGRFDHEFVLATREENLKHAEAMKKNPHMEHDEPNAKRLAPGISAEILWRFTRRGEFDFSCLIPGHLDAGMTGIVVVK
jgi:uncharacterized cupredoxin-like copper-binding protein